MVVLKQIAEVASRTSNTLIQDAVGAAALGVILIVGLHLPNFI